MGARIEPVPFLYLALLSYHVCCVQGPAAKAEEEGRIVIAANNPISCLHEYAKKVGLHFLPLIKLLSFVATLETVER
jgi:hypothetical protein